MGDGRWKIGDAGCGMRDANKGESAVAAALCRRVRLLTSSLRQGYSESVREQAAWQADLRFDSKEIHLARRTEAVLRCDRFNSDKIGRKELIWQMNGSGEKRKDRNHRRGRERWAAPNRLRTMKQVDEASNSWRRVSTAAPALTSGRTGSGLPAGNAGRRVPRWWRDGTKKVTCDG